MCWHLQCMHDVTFAEHSRQWGCPWGNQHLPYILQGCSRSRLSECRQHLGGPGRWTQGTHNQEQCGHAVTTPMPATGTTKLKVFDNSPPAAAFRVQQMHQSATEQEMQFSLGSFHAADPSGWQSTPSPAAMPILVCTSPTRHVQTPTVSQHAEARRRPGAQGPM